MVSNPRGADFEARLCLFNSHCWVDRHSDTAGLLFTQLVPHGHRDVNTLFDAYHTAVRTEHHNRPSRSPVETVLENFNFFREGAVWWV